MGNGTRALAPSDRVARAPAQSGAGEPAPVHSHSALGGGLALLLLALAPAVAAIWAVPWFVTQDGPAHLYNARIVSESIGGFGPLSPFGDVYEVRWQPIPNWAGPISLAVLLSWLPAWKADRIITTVTLVGFAAAVFWLRWRVAGERGLRVVALWSALLAMNFTWLLGFASFMLGACLFPITLGVWWGGRDTLKAGRMVFLSFLLALGYFCHLVSLGLTVVGLLVLAVWAPGRPGRIAVGANGSRDCLERRSACCRWLAWAAVYLSIAQAGGRMAPTWDNLSIHGRREHGSSGWNGSTR